MIRTCQPSVETPLDEDARKRALKLRALLADPVAFKGWADETLDMSRLRSKRRAAKVKKKPAT